MPRDKKGRFKKIAEDETKESCDERFKLSLSLPSLKATINWILIFLMIMPQISVMIRYNIVGKLFNKFEEFFSAKSSDDAETQKKTEYFIKNVINILNKLFN